jgi:flagellin-like protein
LTRISNVRKTTKFKRSIKAISPVIATLLMIAIAVVASLVVYAWVSGYIGGATSKAGNSIQIQSFASSGGNLVVYVQNVGQGVVSLSPDQSIYVNGDLVKIINQGTGSVTIPEGQTVELKTDFSPSQNQKLNIKVTTSGGTFTQATGTATNTAAPTPTANDDTYTVIENQVLNVAAKGVLSNDLNVNAVVLPAGSTSHGAVTVNSDGSFGYTPTTGYTGDDSFTYQATDGTTTTSAATVTIHVVIAPPVLDHFEIVAPTGRVTQNTAFSMTITAKDQYDGTLQSYTGTNTLTVSSGAISPTDTTAFSSGVWSSDQVTLSATGSITIATTGNSKTGTAIVMVDPPIAQHNVNFILGSNGQSVSPSGVHSIAETQNPVSITATAASGYHFDHWVATGSITFGDANSASTTATITTDGTITATFAANTFTITASAGSGGTISPSGAVSVNQGANQAFTIAANTGYHVSAVTVDGTSQGAITTYTFTNVQAAHTISATFAANTFTITASAGSGGTISPSGAVSVNQGANQAFTIAANTGYHVSAVTVDGTSQGAITTYTFTNVQAAHTISATFAANTFTITASAGSGGTISPSGAVSVNQGANQAFTIAANTGYHVSAVTVDGTSQGAITTYTFTNVQAAHTISATFAANTPVVVTQSPTAYTDGSTHWSSQNKAYTSDNSYATANSDGANEKYSGYGFSIPTDATVTKVQIRIDGYVSYNDQFKIEVSTNGGTSFSATTDVYSPGTTEGTHWTDATSWASWTPSMINNNQIQVRITQVKVSSTDTVYLDWLPVEVTYVPA